MAFDIDFVTNHARAILQIEGHADKASQVMWHKKMLATHINLHMGEIGEALTESQEAIVDGFIQHIARRAQRRTAQGRTPLQLRRILVRFVFG